MPNYCAYDLRVTGHPRDVAEFEKIIQADYDYNKNEFTHKPHLYRVFDAMLCEYESDGPVESKTFCGDCAWSVSTCMMPDRFGFDKRDTLKYLTDIVESSERLNLGIEVYSSECGMEFQEHIMVKNGFVLENTCEDYEEFDMEEVIMKERTLEDVCEEYDLDVNDVRKHWHGESYYVPRVLFDENGGWVMDKLKKPAYIIPAQV